MATPPAQSYLLENRQLLEDAGFVPIGYANRNTVSFMKCIETKQELAVAFESTEEVPENLHDIWDAEEDFSLMHPSDQPQPERDRNFIVIEITADGMVKRMNGAGGHIEGPFALGTAPARKLLKSTGVDLPLLDAEIVPPSLKPVPVEE